MLKEEDIIKEAESWLGTKWGHNVALKGYKADCIQFIIAFYRDLGWLPENFKTFKYNRDYALHNSESQLLAEIQKHCNQVNLNEITVGDVLLFKFGKCASHSAIYIGSGKMIHSEIRNGVVISHLKSYMDKFVSAWRLKSG